MWLNVILTVDERLDDVRDCVKSLRAVFGKDAPIALATYGGKFIKEQPLSREYAQDNGLLYYDAPRHDFLTDDDVKEWHASETLARIQITQHFAAMGFFETYIMHADVIALADFRKAFNEMATGAWSFIGVVLRAAESFKDLCGKGSWGLYFEGNPARFSDIITRYNPLFVAKLYVEYGGDRGIWEAVLSSSTLWGDLAQFDLARELFGFTARAIHDESDNFPICQGTILHVARQRMLSGVPRVDADTIRRNYERRKK